GACACTTQNLDHCNYRGGDSFCAAGQSERPYCSVCAADFDGCTNDPPSAECLPEGSSSASASASSTATSLTSSGSASDATTAGTATTSTSTSTATSTTEGETSTTTTTSTTTSSTTDDSTTSSTTEAPDLCGNGMLDENEVCDGDKFGGKTCLDFGWTGGKLGCADDCSAISQAACCQGAGSSCGGNMPCCAGLDCGF
ncbi:MAG: hypothetical protein KC420_22815, partial [Myxococcales bacterium]|nr:hypothetical protein [Myxococcales bacterium]